MYSATVLLSHVKFQPIAAGCMTCTISPPHDISPLPAKVFGGDGETITIAPPPRYCGSVQLIYQLPDPTYVLLGLSFRGSATQPTRQEFRSIEISCDLTGSQLTLTVACIHKAKRIDFEYYILIQQISTGEIGIIDPRIIAEPN